MVGYVPPSSEFSRTGPNLRSGWPLWEESHMAEHDGATPLQLAIRRAIAASGKTRDHFDRLLQKKLGTKGKPIYDIDRGKSKSPSAETVTAIAEVFGKPLSYFMPDAEAPDLPVVVRAHAGDESVEIAQLDLSFSMGPGTTIDDYIEETALRFDLDYIRAFSRAPPHRLRIARGVGESMFPTLASSDLVWIDTTQTMLNQQDRIWAISLFGAAAIKRLRTIGDGKVMVISDNANVENQVVDAADLIIGGRVIRFSRDL